MATRAWVIGLGALLLSACGGQAGDTADQADQSGDVAQTSVQALCAGAPEQRSSNIVTTIACPFEQQYANVERYGQDIGALEIRDDDGQTIGVATRSCDTWLLATGDDGVQVFMDSLSGEVRAHGAVHVGKALSNLPARVAVPFSLEEK